MSPELTEQSKTPEHGEHSPREVARKITGVVLEQLRQADSEASIEQVVNELAQTDFAKVAEAVMAQVETPAETLQAPDASSALASVDRAFTDFDQDVQRRHEDDRGEHLQRVITKRQELQTWVQEQVEALKSGDRSVWEELQQKVDAFQRLIRLEVSSSESAMWTKKDAMKQLEQQHAGVPSIKDEVSARVSREIGSETTRVVEALFTQTDIPSNLSYAFSNLRAGSGATVSELQDHQRSQAESAATLVQRVEQDLNGLDRWNQVAGNIDTARTMQDIQDAVNALQFFFESNRMVAAAAQAASSPQFVDFFGFVDRIRTAPTVYQAREIFSQVDGLVQGLIRDKQTVLNIFQSFSPDSGGMSTRQQRQLAALQGVTTEDQRQYAQLSREVQSLSGDKHVLEGLVFPAKRMKMAVDDFLQSQSAATEAQTQYDRSLGQALESGSASLPEGLSTEAKRILEAVFASLKDELVGMSPEQVQQVQEAILKRVGLGQEYQTREVARTEQRQRQEALDQRRRELSDQYPTISVESWKQIESDLKARSKDAITTEQITDVLSDWEQFLQQVDSNIELATEALAAYESDTDNFVREIRDWINIKVALEGIQKSSREEKQDLTEAKSAMERKERRNIEDEAEFRQKELLRTELLNRLQPQIEEATTIQEITKLLRQLADVNTKLVNESEQYDPNRIIEIIESAYKASVSGDQQFMERVTQSLPEFLGIRQKVQTQLRSILDEQQELRRVYEAALQVLGSEASTLEQIQEALRSLANNEMVIKVTNSRSNQSSYNPNEILRGIQAVLSASSQQEAEKRAQQLTRLGDINKKAFKAYKDAHSIGARIKRILRIN